MWRGRAKMPEPSIHRGRMNLMDSERSCRQRAPTDLSGRRSKGEARRAPSVNSEELDEVIRGQGPV